MPKIILLSLIPTRKVISDFNNFQIFFFFCNFILWVHFIALSKILWVHAPAAPVLTQALPLSRKDLVRKNSAKKCNDKIHICDSAMEESKNRLVNNCSSLHNLSSEQSKSTNLVLYFLPVKNCGYFFVAILGLILSFQVFPG